jgi:hypothetical protein
MEILVQIFLQVFAISAMNTYACILYAILERLHPSQWVVTMAQFAWQVFKDINVY